MTNDLSNHSDYQSSPLVSRLDRRRTESVGVVPMQTFDARSPQVPGWIIQRSQMLQQLTSRYSRDSDTSGADNLVWATSQPVPPPPVSTTAQSSVPWAAPAIASSTTVSTPISQSVPPPNNPPFRISRKPIAASSSVSKSAVSDRSSSNASPAIVQSSSATPSVDYASSNAVPAIAQSSSTIPSPDHSTTAAQPLSQSSISYSTSHNGDLSSDSHTEAPIVHSSQIAPIAERSPESLILAKRSDSGNSDAIASHNFPPRRGEVSGRPLFPNDSTRIQRSAAHSPSPSNLSSSNSSAPAIDRSTNQAISGSNPSIQLSDHQNLIASNLSTPAIAQERISISQEIAPASETLILPKRTSTSSIVISNDSGQQSTTSPSSSLQSNNLISSHQQGIYSSSSTSGSSPTQSSYQASNSSSNLSSPIPSIAASLALPTSDVPLILRKVQATETSNSPPTQTDVSSTRSDVSSTRSDLPPPPITHPTAVEFPSTPLSHNQHTLIWRKSLPTPTMPTINYTANSPAIARQTSQSIAPMAESSPESSTTQSQSIDRVAMPSIPEIAEQVSRILQRQLIVERERRGMPSW